MGGRLFRSFENVMGQNSYSQVKCPLPIQKLKEVRELNSLTFHSDWRGISISCATCTHEFFVCFGLIGHVASRV